MLPLSKKPSHIYSYDGFQQSLIMKNLLYINGKKVEQKRKNEHGTFDISSQRVTINNKTVPNAIRGQSCHRFIREKKSSNGLASSSSFSSSAAPSDVNSSRESSVTSPRSSSVFMGGFSSTPSLTGS